MNLRAACIHGRYERHTDLYGFKVNQPCPGGREVTIDLEAATEALRREHQRIHNIMDADDYWGYLSDLASVAVLAAIGDGDD